MSSTNLSPLRFSQTALNIPASAFGLTFQLRATRIDGSICEPIECETEQQVHDRMAALGELGYLDPRVRITKRSSRKR